MGQTQLFSATGQATVTITVNFTTDSGGLPHVAPTGPITTIVVLVVGAPITMQFGQNPNGTWQHTDSVPSGTTTVTPAQLAPLGIVNVQDIGAMSWQAT